MYLPQHIKLFEGSILDNIRYTHTSLTHDDVHQVLVRFDVSSILQQTHPTHNYLDRSVGVGGSQVSGGQKQVIILMRTCIDTFLQHDHAVSTDKSVLVLDEPTASLDDNMVEVVMRLLQKMKSTHTILMITHNQHIAKQCDTITPFF
jgi:ABC-type bacteriocin/lantibiotic exporter with double-glycine peptidase domain